MNTLYTFDNTCAYIILYAQLVIKIIEYIYIIALGSFAFRGEGRVSDWGKCPGQKNVNIYLVINTGDGYSSTFLVK